MQKSNTSRGMLLIYSSFVMIVSIVIPIGMLVSPSEPGSSILLGLSLPRLVLAVALLTVAGFSALLLIKASKDHGWADRILEQWFGEGQR